MVIIDISQKFIFSFYICIGDIEKFNKIKKVNPFLFHDCFEVESLSKKMKKFHVNNCCIKRADIIRRLIKDMI